MNFKWSVSMGKAAREITFQKRGLIEEQTQLFAQEETGA